MTSAADEPGRSAEEAAGRPSVTLRDVEAKARELEEAVAGAGDNARNKAKLAALAAVASAGLVGFWRRSRRRGATKVEIHRL